MCICYFHFNRRYFFCLYNKHIFWPYSIKQHWMPLTFSVWKKAKKKLRVSKNVFLIFIKHLLICWKKVLINCFSFFLYKTDTFIIIENACINVWMFMSQLREYVIIIHITHQIRPSRANDQAWVGVKKKAELLISSDISSSNQDKSSFQRNISPMVHESVRLCSKPQC